MSRGNGIQYNSPIIANNSRHQKLHNMKNHFDENGNKSQNHHINLSPTTPVSIDYYPLKSHVDQYNLTTYHTFKINENIARLPPIITNVFNQLMEKSNVDRNKFISNELCENPIQLNYNPNKSTSICRENNGRIEKRKRNNAASRISRYKRKRQYQLSTITSEYLENANESLSVELSQMAAVIRQKQIELADKLNSIEYVVQLREKCGLTACLF